MTGPANSKSDSDIGRRSFLTGTAAAALLRVPALAGQIWPAPQDAELVALGEQWERAINVVNEAERHCIELSDQHAAVSCINQSEARLCEENGRLTALEDEIFRTPASALN